MEIKIEGNGAGKRLVFVEKLARGGKRSTSLELTEDLIRDIHGLVTGDRVVLPYEVYSHLVNEYQKSKDK